MLRVITNRYAGQSCASCNKPLNQWAKVRWNGNGKVYCLKQADHNGDKSGVDSQIILISPSNQIQVYRVDSDTMAAVFDLLPNEEMSHNLPAIEKPVIEYAPVVPERIPETVPDGPYLTDEEVDALPVKPEVKADPMTSLFAMLQES